MVTNLVSSTRGAIPPVRCGAIVKATGERCKRYATPGTTACRMHGASAPQVRRKAMTTNVIAEMLRQDPRPVEQVVIDAIHHCDVVMRDHVAKIEAQDDVSAKDLARLVNLSQVAHSLASSAITQKLLAFRLRQATIDFGVTRMVITTMLDALESQLAPRSLGDGYEISVLRLWMVRVIQEAIRQVYDRPPGDATWEVHALEELPPGQPYRNPFPVADVLAAIPWPDELAGLTVSFSPPDRPQDRERARPFALNASSDSALDEPSVAPAPPFSGPGPVMGRPGVPHVPAAPDVVRTGQLTEPEPTTWDGTPTWLPPPDLGGLGRVAEPVLVGFLLDGDNDGDDKYRHEPRWW